MFPLSGNAKRALKNRSFRLNVLSKFFKRYRTRQRKILNENAQDYLRSIALRQVLAPLRNADVVDLSITEQQIGDTWQPFRIEHALSGSLRGDISGRTFTGIATPSLLDSSSVIFLQKPNGETLRAIIPSPATAREMLAQAIKYWTNAAGGKNEPYSYAPSGTHTGYVIHRFALDQNMSESLEHPATIDKIDASCQKLLAERPSVQVFGKPIREGVVLVTALTVNGKTHIFVPTKFFQILAGEVQRFVRTNYEPRLLAA